MIKIKSLTNDDVGKCVIYDAGHGKPELGKIKSWNEYYVFVVYYGENKDKEKNFMNYTAAGTEPKYLVFYK